MRLFKTQLKGAVSSSFIANTAGVSRRRFPNLLKGAWAAFLEENDSVHQHY